MPFAFLGFCGRPAAPSLPDLPLPKIPAAPADSWGHIAYVGAWIGGGVFALGMLLLLAAVIFRAGPGIKTALQILTAGLAISVSMQLMLWIGPHIKTIALLILLGGLALALLYGWFQRKFLIWYAEYFASQDLDGDKHIGRPRR